VHVLDRVLGNAKERRTLTVQELEWKMPEITAEVQNKEDPAIDREVYQALATMLAKQGLKKRTGLQQEMAKFLGVSAATVSRKMNCAE
jgi:transcriptional regulator with PAS, ATPase and Fis domain